MFKIIGNTGENEHAEVLHKLIKQFMPYSQEKLGFDKPVTIDLLSDPDNASNPLGKTAQYDPNNMKVTLFIDKRHVKDILRSLSHEMVHHTQNCQGKFNTGMDTGPGYAQDNEHLRNQEKQAYLLGNIHFRDWEDGIKMQQQENKQMRSKKLANEIKRIVREEVQKLEEKDWYEYLPRIDAFNITGGGNVGRQERRLKHLPRAAGVAAENVPTDIFNIAGGGDKGEMRNMPAMSDAERRRQLRRAAGLEEDINLDEELQALFEEDDEGCSCPKECPKHEKPKKVSKLKSEDAPVGGSLDEEYRLFEETLDEFLGAGMNPDETNENWNADGLLDEELQYIEEGDVPPGWTRIPDSTGQGKKCYSTPKGPRCAPSPEEKMKRKGMKRVERKDLGENWHKGGKDQLLFEELTRKWTKKR